MSPSRSLDGLPGELAAVLRGRQLVPVTHGRSGSTVARAVKEDRPDLFVKLIEVAGDSPSLRHEADRLVWLAGKVPVPELVLHGRDEHAEWLVTSALVGADATSGEMASDAERLVAVLGESLRAFHDTLDAATCPFVASTESLVQIASDRVQAGLVDASDFDPVHYGVTPEELLGHVTASQPTEPTDPVVTHGDYCVPNVILAGGSLSGYVDLGLVGVGDRYRDLGIGARSIAYNLGGTAVGPFFDAYGIEWPDLARVDFFVTLDELF